MGVSPSVAEIEVVALDAAGYAAAIPDLADLLVDAVDGGASVNFLAGLGRDEASAWWAARLEQVREGTVTPFVARADRPSGRAIVGSTLLIRSRNPNSPHRAEIAKVLVHRSARRLGIGRSLMEAAERAALAEGRWLLLLDTQVGTGADAFYRALGWTELGTMPDHSLRTDGVLAPTAFFWKDLRS